jgi:hypothetical protein
MRQFGEGAVNRGTRFIVQNGDKSPNRGPSEQTEELSDAQLDNVVGGAAALALMEEEGLFLLKTRRPNLDGVVILHTSLPGGD